MSLARYDSSQLTLRASRASMAGASSLRTIMGPAPGPAPAPGAVVPGAGAVVPEGVGAVEGASVYASLVHPSCIIA